MPSFYALTAYNFITNLWIGSMYFIAVLGLGRLTFKFLPYTIPSVIRPLVLTVFGFLLISLLIQILSFFFWINTYSLTLLVGLLVVGLLWEFYTFYKNTRQITIHYKTNLLKTPEVVCFLLSFFPILIYAILPSTKIDELFYHQLVSQRIITDGGLIFYRQPWEAAIPPHLIYNFSHVPLVYLGFPDAANVVSFLIFALFLQTIYKILSQANITSFFRWTILSLFCLGMYRLTFTTAGSHHFGDAAAFLSLYVVLNLSSLKQHTSYQAILTIQGILLAAVAGSKMSLLPYAVLVGIYTLYEVFGKNKLSGRSIFHLLWPIVLFYIPIIIWTYIQTHSPFGLILSQYFDTKIIDRHLLESTLMDEIVTTPTFSEHLQAALLHFPFILLLSPLLFMVSSYSKEVKIKVLSLFFLYLFILYHFHLLYHPRFWGNLPLSLFLLTALAPPKLPVVSQLWISKKSILKWGMIMAAIVPYLAIFYYYLYHLRPFPINEQTKITFYKRFIPLYEDYIALDKLLPKEACLYTQNRLNLIQAPRRIFKDTLDICGCHSVYALQCEQLLLPSRMSIQGKMYKMDKLIYQNREAKIKIYRTPSKKPMTGNLSVFKLIPI
ncbi:MAG: hypothetical protein U0X91_17530 [Spirosomataceae bacterium]